MSDPLQTTRSTLDAVEMSTQPFQTMSAAKAYSAVPKKLNYADQSVAAKAIQAANLDVSLQRGVLYPAAHVANPEIAKRLAGSKRDEVLEASETNSLDVRVPVPRLLRVCQEMHAALPTALPFGATKGSAKSAAAAKAMVGGGAHTALGRLLQFAPKQRQEPTAPPSLGEVGAALVACGRTLKHEPSPQARDIEFGGPGRGVEFDPHSDNGFPVGLNMTDPHARETVLELAQGLYSRLDRLPSFETKLAQVKLLQDTRPEYCLLKGKAKTDMYGLDKMSAYRLRFYNVLGRQWMLICQKATQPVAQAWKDHAHLDDLYRTMIGRGLAGGGARDLVRYLSDKAANAGMAWTHAGDDTWIVRRFERDGKEVWEMFSVDCTAFDLTQHRAVLRPVHELFSRQLRAADETAAAAWSAFMEQRDVTVSGSVVVRTKHWGASGLPLQSEINDTLMEVYCTRLEKETWGDKEQLDGVLQRLGQALGWQVRLEDYFQMEFKSNEGSLEAMLRVRPFLFVGYHFHIREEDIRVQIDLNRFMAGMPYLGGGFEKDKAVAGVKAALALGGYALAFGQPTEAHEPAYNILVEAAVEAISNKAAEISAAGVESELRKYVYAGLAGGIETPQGLIDAIRRAHGIWAGHGREAVSQWSPEVAGAWADEPVNIWDEKFWPKSSGPVRLAEQRNAAGGVSVANAGRVPPTPSVVLEERARAAAERAKHTEAVSTQRAQRGSRKKNNRDKRSGVLSEGSEDEGSLLWELD